MRWLAAIEMLVPGLLLWASFVTLLYIRDWVLYGLTARAPQAQKAEALIREWLSPEQLRQYEEWRKFEVTGSGGGRYLITPAYIHVLEYWAAHLLRAGEFQRSSNCGHNARAQNRIGE